MRAIKDEKGNFMMSSWVKNDNHDNVDYTPGREKKMEKMLNLYKSLTFNFSSKIKTLNFAASDINIEEFMPH